MSCCGRSSVWGALVAVGLAGAVGGVIAGRAFDGAPAGPGPSPAVEPASFAQPEGEASPEEMMAAMKELSKPVEEHERLAEMAGEWDCEAKFYMNGPDAEPTVTKGTTSSRMVLGGRYLLQHFKIDDFMGEPFEGMGFVGYDRANGRYVNDWIDTWSTGIMGMTGEFDEESKTMDWHGSWDMATPQGPVNMPAHHIVKHEGPDRFVMEFWEAGPDGEEFKGGEIVYTRRK